MINQDSDSLRVEGKTAVFKIAFLLLTLLLIVPLLSAQSNSVGAPPDALPLPENTASQADSPPEASPAGTASLPAVYLPFIAKPPLCSLNAEETAVAQLAENDPNQQRATMNCHPILAQVAREKARDMAVRNYFDHTNPDGFGPNYLVRQAGYRLPDWYGSNNNSNNIESIAAGYTTPEAVWEGWLTSSGHRAHVLGESSFWRDQTNFGIGYYFDDSTLYRHFWVFISAPPEE